MGLAKADLGKMPVADIKPAAVLTVLRKVEARKNYETARRLRSTIAQVFNLAIQTERREVGNPADPLRGALIAPTVTHRPAITDAKEFAAPLRRSQTFFTGRRLPLQTKPRHFLDVLGALDGAE